MKTTWETLQDWLFGPLPPVIKTLPDHIRDMPLDMGLIALQMERSHQINPAVNPRLTLPTERA